MRCPNHLRKEVAGYCCICAAFMCEDCLTTHEGQLYCPKHYKPFAQEKARAEVSREVRKRHGRHKLVVHFLDGRIEKGICMVMNVKDSGFHLECVDERGATVGRTEKVRFKDLKAVFNVHSFDGKTDKPEHHPDYAPGGSKVTVVFKDGEEMPGTTMNPYDPDDPRFYLLPEDVKSNNITVLVEATAVQGVYTAEELAEFKKAKERKERQEQAKIAQAEQQESAELSQEESMGDFYFETHNYTGALEQYRISMNSAPNSRRIRKKYVISAINVGIQYIKSRDYLNALKYMKLALEVEPDNPHAIKKSKQLEKVIKKTQRRMEEYARQKEQMRATTPPPDFDLDDF